MATSLLDDRQLGSTIRTLYLDFGTSLLSYVRKSTLNLVSPSARIEHALCEGSDDDALARDQEIQFTTEALKELQATSERTTRTYPTFPVWDADEAKNEDVDITLNMKVYHQSMEFIFARCTGLLKLSSSRLFSSESGLPMDTARTKYTSIQGACPPFWRVVQRLRCEELVSMDLDYRSMPGRQLDLSRFQRLRFMTLRPPGTVQDEDVESQCVSTSMAPAVVTSLPLLEHFSYCNTTAMYSDDISDSQMLASLASYR